MFTPVVLICALNSFTPETCAPLMKPVFFATKEECIIDIAIAFDNGAFRGTTEGVQYDMHDFWCVDWTAVKA
jgi:hypothetical protein